MFAVIFEVHPRATQWERYLDTAQALRPELLQVDGFLENIRYRSLTRERWILSLSAWRDEKAVVRWRTTMRHHLAQEKGRSEIFADYHLRVGEIIQDTHLPDGQALRDQRLDETAVGEGTTVTLITARRRGPREPEDTAADLGLRTEQDGLVGWDVFDAVLTPGDLILLASWRTNERARCFEQSLKLRDDARLRRVRVVRDYGMFDRREAPQYYPEVRAPGQNE